MPLGILSDDDLKEEIENISKKVEKRKEETARIQEMNRGGNPTGKTTPESLRKVIGANAIEEGNSATQELLQGFNLTKHALSAYKNGSNSDQGKYEKNEGLVNHLNKVREGLTLKATSKLDLALSSITEAKMQGEKARDLAAIAKDMSVIVKNIEGNNGPGVQNNQFVIYAPHVTNEERFEKVITPEYYESQ